MGFREDLDGSYGEFMVRGIYKYGLFPRWGPYHGGGGDREHGARAHVFLQPAQSGLGDLSLQSPLVRSPYTPYSIYICKGDYV